MNVFFAVAQLFIKQKLYFGFYFFFQFQLNRLYKFIEQKGELHELAATMASLTKQKLGVGALAKQGLKDLEEIIGLVKRLGIKSQVRIY